MRDRQPDLEPVIDAVERRGVVACPAATLYGLGVDATKDAASLSEVTSPISPEAKGLMRPSRHPRIRDGAISTATVVTALREEI